MTERRNWSDARQQFAGDPVGYNVRVAKASDLGEMMARMEDRMKERGEKVRSRCNKNYIYLKLRGNELETTTV